MSLFTVDQKECRRDGLCVAECPAYGEMAFTVPLFDEFMRRAIPEFQLGKNNS